MLEDRVIYVWIYNNTNRSVFSAILFHDIDNISWLTLPVGRSYFDPRITSPILVCVAVAVIVLSGQHLQKRFRANR